MRQRLRLISIAIVASLFGTGLPGVAAFAQPSDARSREAATMEFARSHHPELAKLLDRLESTDRKAYDKAVKDVAQTSERLGKLAESDPERYALSLRTWTLDSRIRLLAARSTMSDDPGIEAELRDLLRERRKARVAMLRFDRDRLAARLEKLDGQLELLERDAEESIEQDLARINRNIKASTERRRRSTDSTDAAKRDGKAGETRNAKRKLPAAEGRNPKSRNAARKDDLRKDDGRKDGTSKSDDDTRSGDVKSPRSGTSETNAPTKSSNRRPDERRSNADG